MIEEWRIISEFPNYEVSNLGQVRRKNRVLKQHKWEGYCKVKLSKDGIAYTKQVHRLVAEAFIPKLDDKPEIDHIDRVRDNNCVTNLRWADHTEQAYNRNFVKENHHIHLQKNGTYQIRVIINKQSISQTVRNYQEALKLRDEILTSLI